MATPRILVVTGYGINCDDETKFAFEKAGGIADIVHVNDLIARKDKLRDCQILAFPGGFSYGDDTGSGKALAHKIKNNLWEEVLTFVHADNLGIGICNGFQVMTHLGLVPAFDTNYGEAQIALVHNDNARYTTRWVDVTFEGGSPWVKNIPQISLPIAHGEGKFYADTHTLRSLNQRGLVAARYTKGEICRLQNLKPNPNGSLEDIAAITDQSGRLFGLMPHPERAIDFTHLPHWTWLKENYRRKRKSLPHNGPGLQIFKNGVNYFK